MSKNYTAYRKWSEVPEWEKLVIDVIRELAEKNKIFTLNDVHKLCDERFISVPNGRKSIGQAFRMMVEWDFFYAKIIKRTQVKGEYTTICQSFIYGENQNEKVG